MKLAAVLIGLVCGLGLPIFAFGLIICLLSLVDVAGQIAGVGTE